MTRDDFVREFRNRSGTWQALAGVYALLVGLMALTGYMITG